MAGSQHHQRRGICTEGAANTPAPETRNYYREPTASNWANAKWLFEMGASCRAMWWQSGGADRVRRISENQISQLLLLMAEEQYKIIFVFTADIGAGTAWAEPARLRSQYGSR